QDQTQAVADYLNGNAVALSIEEVMAGRELTLKFNDPATDSRVPDIIVQPAYGTIYTGSKKKNAEHGGFSFGDTNVGLIVSRPGLDARVVKTPVATSQVAPTILEALGIDPTALKAVRLEHTRTLPGFDASGRDRESRAGRVLASARSLRPPRALPAKGVGARARPGSGARRARCTPAAR